MSNEIAKEKRSVGNTHAIDILLHVQNTLNCVRDQVQLGIEGPYVFDRFDFSSIDVANERIKNVIEYLDTGKLNETIQLSSY